MQLKAVDPAQMVAVYIDRDVVEELVVSFSSDGLHHVGETSDWRFLNFIFPHDMKLFATVNRNEKSVAYTDYLNHGWA